MAAYSTSTIQDTGHTSLVPGVPEAIGFYGPRLGATRYQRSGSTHHPLTTCEASVGEARPSRSPEPTREACEIRQGGAFLRQAA